MKGQSLGYIFINTDQKNKTFRLYTACLTMQDRYIMDTGCTCEFCIKLYSSSLPTQQASKERSGVAAPICITIILHPSWFMHIGGWMLILDDGCECCGSYKGLANTLFM